MAPTATQKRRPIVKTEWKTIFPWLLSIVTIAIGIWQYADKQAQANRKPFLQKQLELVFEASDTVALLATTSNDGEWLKAHARFWTLYWGPLGIVENQAVVHCMVQAGRIIGEPGLNVAPELPLSKLHGTSLALAVASRELILDSWQVELPPLDNVNKNPGCKPGEAGGGSASN